jgi:DNA-binding CsgD family transcriptional regulator
MERLGCAGVLVDRDGTVRRVNRLAETLFCSDFWVRDGRLWVSRHSEATRLNRLVALSSRGADQNEVASLGPVTISRDGMPWLAIDAMPLVSVAVDLFGANGSLLLINDLLRSNGGLGPLIGRAFGLTPAETRLAEALHEGRSLDRAAAEFGLSRETLRTHLKAIFRKTGCSRQSDLVALVTRLRAFKHQ